MAGNIEVFERLFAAVERRDLPALLDCYDPDIEIHESASLPYGGIYRGYEGARRHAARFLRAWGPYQGGASLTLDARFAEMDERTVVAVFRHRARDAAGSRRLDTPEIGLYELRAGKVLRSQMFHFDPAELTRFLDGVGRAVTDTDQGP